MSKEMKTIPLSAVLNQEDGGYVSLCTELDIASQGETIEEALSNLKEAVEGFFETASPEEIKERLKKPSLFTHIEVACA
jgi:predicted RNase H-like HicB family nuclease